MDLGNSALGLAKEEGAGPPCMVGGWYFLPPDPARMLNGGAGALGASALKKELAEYPFRVALRLLLVRCRDKSSDNEPANMGLLWLSWSCGCGSGIVEDTWEGTEEDFDPELCEALSLLCPSDGYSLSYVDVFRVGIGDVR